MATPFSQYPGSIAWLIVFPLYQPVFHILSVFQGYPESHCFTAPTTKLGWARVTTNLTNFPATFPRSHAPSYPQSNFNIVDTVIMSEYEVVHVIFLLKILQPLPIPSWGNVTPYHLLYMGLIGILLLKGLMGIIGLLCIKHSWRADFLIKHRLMHLLSCVLVHQFL